MQPPGSIARTLYRWCALLALPGGLWTVFEMYGLTMDGPQMLFFSISHTLAPMLLAVFLSLPTGALWLTQTVVALLVPAYAARLGFPRRALVIFSATLGADAVALWFYEDWSYLPSLRVAVCALGLLLSVLALREAWAQLRHANPPSTPIASEA